MARYVPKTYNNRRGLRIILGVFATLALAVVIIFFILFFYLQNYVVDGQLVHPLLDDWDNLPAVVIDADEMDNYETDSYDYNAGDGYGYENDYESNYEPDNADDHSYNENEGN